MENTTNLIESVTEDEDRILDILDELHSNLVKFKKTKEPVFNDIFEIEVGFRLVDLSKDVKESFEVIREWIMNNNLD